MGKGTSSDLAPLAGVPFAKMTGSGNDFVFFDARTLPFGFEVTPDIVVAICNRHNGIGADGIVILEADPDAGGVQIAYYNSDGSPADLCGNATLCSTTLSVELGLSQAGGMQLRTPAGSIAARLVDGVPEIDLPALTLVDPSVPIETSAAETRIGFAMAGIPHLVVLCEDADRIDVGGRGPTLRHHPALGSAGANVNWVSRLGSSWRYRTFERGVEGETLACGTGAVATAALLAAWQSAESSVVMRTSSGRNLHVSFGDGGRASLRGEGRVVFSGTISA